MSDRFVVRAVNTGGADFPISHNRELLVIPAGGDRVVPYDAMASLWGDPGYRDDPANGVTRQQLSLQLRGHFGWFAGLDTDQGWEERRPPIEWYTLEGDRVWTVLDDPTGANAAAAGPAPVSLDAPFLADQIDRLNQRIQQLQDALDQRNAAAAQAAQEPLTAADTGELPTPDPAEAAVKADNPTGPRLKGR